MQVTVSGMAHARAGEGGSMIGAFSALAMTLDAVGAERPGALRRGGGIFVKLTLVRVIAGRNFFKPLAVVGCVVGCGNANERRYKKNDEP